VALFDGQYGRVWAMLRSACGRLIWIKSRNIKDLTDILGVFSKPFDLDQ
jgi:hypothetical protein